MTLYLLVVGLWLSAPGPYTEITCYRHDKLQCSDEHGVILNATAPRVDFFLSQDTAAKEYAAQPKGSARLFKITLPWYASLLYKRGECPDQTREACDLSIKEMNVLPAQSYEVSDKASVEVGP